MITIRNNDIEIISLTRSSKIRTVEETVGSDGIGFLVYEKKQRGMEKAIRCEVSRCGKVN